MMEPALGLLVERLLCPVPRIRWESGRSLARLIREGHAGASEALLCWMGDRKLESEVTIGLSVIDAFELGGFLEFSEVNAAVHVPSHLSDLLLRKVFSDGRSQSRFRYGISRPEPAMLPEGQDGWFDRYRQLAVPEIFSIELQSLQELTGFLFMERWRHEWRWLQSEHALPEAEIPRSFRGVDVDSAGPFDVGQREIYVSAYLRTLAYAAVTGVMEHEDAERSSMLAITMNRGLADLEPLERPDWTCSLGALSAPRVRSVADSVWKSVTAGMIPGEVPLAVRALDFDGAGFVEFDIVGTIGRAGFTDGPPEAASMGLVTLEDRPEEMSGTVTRPSSQYPLGTGGPVEMTQCVVPRELGRVHVGMAFNIRLASPFVFRTSGTIQCRSTEICLENGGDTLSRWAHWYTDWKPTIYSGIQSAVGSVTTVAKRLLENAKEIPGVEVARLVRVRWSSRRHIYEKHEVISEAYWDSID